MPPRRSTRRRAKATSKKSTRISKRQAVQSTEEEINEEIDVEEVKIRQEEINENDNVVDDLGRSPEQLKEVNDDTLDDKSCVVAFMKREMDGVLEENLNFNGNEGANQNSVEKETPASDEVVKSLEHMDDISRVQEGGDNEENSDNVLKLPVHMDNCSRVQESGDKEGKGANGVKNDDYNEDNNAIQSPGHKNDFYRVQEGGDGEGKSADEREGKDNVKNAEHSKGKNVMKSPGNLNDFLRVREGGDEEGKRVDDVEDDEDNNVIKSPAHMDDISGVQEGGAEEGNTACEGESIDGVKDNEGYKVNNFMKSPGHADEFIGVQDDGDEEMKSADDMEDNGDGEDNKVMESLGYLDDFSRVQEGNNEDGKSACERESIACAKDNEVNNGMKSPGPAGESIGDQDDGDEELRSADDMEDDGDGEDNKLMESLGHLDDCTDVQEGCDEEGDIADDVEDNEDSDDTEEVEDPSLTNSGKQRQLQIHVTTVHVKGLMKSWNVKKLKELCKQYGEIINVWLPRNFGAKHKDFGFIAFSSHKSALACVEGINKTQFGGETKVKADLAKTRFRGAAQKKGRWGKHHAKYEEVETEIKAQAHGNKSKGTRKRGRGIAKVEIQAPSLLNSTKEGKPNNHRTSFSEGQDANSVKTARNIKNLPQKRNDHGKRKIDHDLNSRQSKKSRGNAQGRQINSNSARKPHREEGSSSISGSKRHRLDMEPHAGYIEPTTRKAAQHYPGYAEAAHWHQRQSHLSYLQHSFQNQSQPSVRYIEPGLGRQALPHAGYIEPAAEKQGFVANDYSLRRAGGYSGQGNQGSAYVRESGVPSSYSQYYTSIAVYQDNVFVQLVCSIQYRIVKENADDAFYELANPREQIQAYVFDVVRAIVPRMALDELFEQKGEVAVAVLEELEKVMGAYGYCIEHILMVDIIPDDTVRRAMNEINAAQRLQLASVYKGEAEKVLQVKRAEADAEAKYLGGVGVARQRQAITDGLRENILEFSHKVTGTSAKEVMDLIMITQYFDTIKDLGNSSKNTTVFIPHGPGHVRDIGDQIRNGLMEASCAQIDQQ